jgi:hypothetical protein
LRPAASSWTGFGGSHHIYLHPQIAEKLSLQPLRGEAKPYQIRQFLALAEKYHLKPEE